MTHEEITNQYINEVNTLNAAKETFYKALCAYEDAARKASNDIRDIYFEAQCSDGMSLCNVLTMAQRVKELEILVARFNGLKCELG